MLKNTISDNYYFVFILGMLAWYASMSPAIYAEKRDNKSYTNWHNMIMYLPFIYGLVNVIIFYLVSNYIPQYANYYVIGFIMAFFYSGIGRLSGHVDIYDMENINMLHVYAILMYVPLYGVVFNFLDTKILI